MLVAARPLPDHPLASLDDDEIAEVRLDVTLEAAEPGLRITTATAHLLGALRWLGRAEAALVLAGGSAACHCPITGENPLVGLADLACAPGGRLGVIETERVMVHDAMGVSGHSIEQVLSLGEQVATILGSPTRRASAVLILLGTVLVAVVTMAAGPIGFVALVAPHLARLLTGSPQSPLLVSGLTGSLLLVGADLLSQLVLESMPVSVVTNAVGGLYLMVALTVAARGRRSL